MRQNIMNIPIYNNQAFDEFDDLAENMRLWNVEIQKLETGNSTSFLRQLLLQETLILNAIFPGITHQTGDTPPGITFAFYTGSTSGLVFQKREVAQNELMIFSDRDEADVVTRGSQNEVFAISLPEKELRARLEENSSFERQRFTLPNQLSFLKTDAKAKLHLFFQRCIQTVENHPHYLLDNTFLTAMQENIFDAILEIVDPVDLQSPFVTHIPKRQLWKRIDEYLEANLDTPIKVRDLTLATGVSSRTLLRLFYERFGISPKMYTTKLRLNKIKHILRVPSSHPIKISDIANSWGFWHMGQFAADYISFYSMSYRLTPYAIGPD